VEITRFSDLRPRFVWDIVDDAFDLYRERFKLLCGISVMVNAPAYLLYIAMTIGPLANMVQNQGNTKDPLSGMGEFFLGTFLALPLLSIAQVIQSGASTLVVQDALAGRLEDATIGSTFRRVFKRFWPLLGASFLVGLLSFLGLCAFFVGIIFVVMYTAFVAQCVLLEERSIGSAFRRSKDLGSAASGKVLGMIMLTGLLTQTLSGGIQALVEVFYGFVEWGGDVAAQQVQKAVISQSLTGVIAILLAPIVSISMTLLYYDLRVRREGLDLAAAAEETGYELAPDPFGDVSSERVVQNMRRGR
jgi:hypothetical protein